MNQWGGCHSFHFAEDTRTVQKGHVSGVCWGLSPMSPASGWFGSLCTHTRGLLCALCCSDCLHHRLPCSHTGSHFTSQGEVLLELPFDRWENWGMEMVRAFCIGTWVLDGWCHHRGPGRKLTLLCAAQWIRLCKAGFLAQENLMWGSYLILLSSKMSWKKCICLGLLWELHILIG